MTIIKGKLRDKINVDLRRRAELRAELSSLTLKKIGEKHNVHLSTLNYYERRDPHIVLYNFEQNKKWEITDSYKGKHGLKDT